MEKFPGDLENPNVVPGENDQESKKDTDLEEEDKKEFSKENISEGVDKGLLDINILDKLKEDWDDDLDLELSSDSFGDDWVESFPEYEEELSIYRDKKNELIRIYAKEGDPFLKLEEFVNPLRDKYPNFKDCLTAQILLGSTPSRDGDLFLDFEGEDSVRKFIDDELLKNKV